MEHMDSLSHLALRLVATPMAPVVLLLLTATTLPQANRPQKPILLMAILDMTSDASVKLMSIGDARIPVLALQMRSHAESHPVTRPTAALTILSRLLGPALVELLQQ